MPDQNQKKPKRSFGEAYGLYGGVGVQLVASIGAGAWLGFVIDKKFATMPWFLLLGILLGSIGGFYNLYALLKAEKAGKKHG